MRDKARETSVQAYSPVCLYVEIFQTYYDFHFNLIKAPHSDKSKLHTVYAKFNDNRLVLCSLIIACALKQ